MRLHIRGIFCESYYLKADGVMLTFSTFSECNVMRVTASLLRCSCSVSGHCSISGSIASTALFRKSTCKAQAAHIVHACRQNMSAACRTCDHLHALLSATISTFMAVLVDMSMEDLRLSSVRSTFTRTPVLCSHACKNATHNGYSSLSRQLITLYKDIILVAET
jgi:hypothetical protein